MKNTILFLTIVTVALLVVTGCSKSELYGDEISSGDTVSLASLNEHPEKYENQTVKIKGEIILECPTGCWFNLKDESGEIYVDIRPNGLALPQKVGHEAGVERKAVAQDAKIMIGGKGVEVK